MRQLPLRATRATAKFVEQRFLPAPFDRPTACTVHCQDRLQSSSHLGDMHFTEPAFQPGSHAAHGHHRPAQHHASPSSNMPPAVPTGRTPRPLGKATSFADLRFGKSKLFRRFHQRKGDFDFGCAGEESLGALDGDRDGDPAHLAPSFYSERPPPVPAKSARPHDTPRSSIDGPAVRCRIERTPLPPSPN